MRTATTIYTGEVQRDGWLQRFYASATGVEVRTLYGTPSPFGALIHWREHEDVRVSFTEVQLVAELERHVDHLDTLVVIGRSIAHHRRLAREAQEVVLGPTEWTTIDMCEVSA